MSKAVVVAITISVAVAGCASSEVVWTKRSGHFTADEVRMDVGQCAAQADSVPVTAPVRFAFAYNNCMRDKGWYQIEIPTLKHEIYL